MLNRLGTADLEGIMLTKVSRTEKEKYYMTSLIYGFQNTKQMSKQKKNTNSQI